MSVPSWAPKLDSFCFYVLLVQAYLAFLEWFIDTLTWPELVKTYSGESMAWPVPNITPEGQIDEALRLVFYVLVPNAGENPIVMACSRRILVKVHPDRYQQRDVRMHYASLACTEMVCLCLAVLGLGGDTGDIQEMPRILVTPFSPASARANPPSRFKIFAVLVFDRPNFVEH